MSILCFFLKTFLFLYFCQFFCLLQNKLITAHIYWVYVIYWGCVRHCPGSTSWSYWMFDSWESNFTCCGKDVRIFLTKQPSVGILLSPTLPRKVLGPLVLSSGSFQNPTYIVSKSRLLVIPRDFRVTGLKRIGSYLFLLTQKPQLAQLRE